MSQELVPGLVPYLKANPGVSAALGNGALEQDFLPDGVSHGISFLLILDPVLTTFSGFSRHKMRLQFQFQAPTADWQNAMAAATYKALAGKQIRLPGGVFVTCCVYITGRGGRSEASLQHAATADYYLFFNDPIPAS